MKEIVIFRGENSETHQAFNDRIMDTFREIATGPNIGKLKIVLSVDKPPALSVIPFKKQKTAAISIYTDSAFDSAPLKTLSGFAGAYKVEEAIPVAYNKDWHDNETTPGICLLTFFRKKANLKYEQFIDRWHNGHTPLSLRIHPLWHYSRNVVKEKIVESSEVWDGIVDEHFRKKSDLLNPFKFFGNPMVIIPRMIKVLTDVRSFLDYKSMETYLCREIWIKSS